MDTPLPAPEPRPIVPQPPSHARAYVVSAILALLILIGAGGAYWFLHSSYGSLYNLRYLAGPYETRSVNELGLRGPHTVTFGSPGRVIDYAHAGRQLFGTLVDANGHQDVYLLGKNVALTNDGKTKAGLAVSPDGAFVAFAERVQEVAATSTGSFYDVDQWQIKLMDLNGKTVRNLGTGFAPQFFTKNGTNYVSYLTNSSLRIINRSTLATQDVPFDLGSQHSYITMSVSPDGSFAILPDVASNYRLFALQESNGFFRLAPGASLPEGTRSAVFKDDDTIISISGNSTGTFVRSSAVSNPSIIAHARIIPETFIFKVIP